jgi:hypothetical protein
MRLINALAQGYPSPSIISVTQAIFSPLVKNLCLSAAPRSHSELPEVSSSFHKKLSLSITLIPAKILHHVTFGAMAMIATRSRTFRTMGTIAKKILSRMFRTMGTIAANFHHVHIEQWEQ